MIMDVGFDRSIFDFMDTDMMRDAPNETQHEVQ
jgi:hypothetical protein